MKTERNISLGYILVFLNNLFFWMAPWLLYMLRFIDFGQVAIVQAVGLGTRVVMEVPSGVLYSVVTLIAIPFSLLYEKASKKFGSYYLLIGSIGVLVLNYLFSPWIGIAVWTGLFLVRVMYSPIKDGAVAELINTRTPSRIRATTISTYELLRKVPFLILAGFIGTLMDEYGVQWLAFWLAITLLVVSVPQIVYRKMSSSYDK